MSFWEIIWFIVISFAFIAYLMVMFNIIIDLIRDRDTSGWVKAVWIVFLFIAPFITGVVYLIVRGAGMTERNLAAARNMQEAQDSYIRSIAGASPVEQIAQAQALLASGAITQAEFDSLKAKALAG